MLAATASAKNDALANEAPSATVADAPQKQTLVDLADDQDDRPLRFRIDQMSDDSWPHGLVFHVADFR